ncbi:MAG: hypothetical protein EA399_07790 [Desulfovibrionales bacterium]|nr:MAG: hypothetical protein EA399_07790 [Desulfovibrionales bacterium]
MYRTCIDCGRTFQAEKTESWKKRCLPCWRRWKAEQGEQEDHDGMLYAQVLDLRDECIRLRAIIADMRPWADIGRTLADRARDVLFLVHPDKHGGHPVANDIATWINTEVRR